MISELFNHECDHVPRQVNLEFTIGKNGPPNLNSVVVCSLLKKLYPFKDVEKSSVRQLPGYEDRNVYFKGQLEPRAGVTGDALIWPLTSL